MILVNWITFDCFVCVDHFKILVNIQKQYDQPLSCESDECYLLWFALVKMKYLLSIVRYNNIYFFGKVNEINFNSLKWKLLKFIEKDLYVKQLQVKIYLTV